jgi:hypothetical protein
LPREESGGCLHFLARWVSGAEVARARFRRWCGTWEPLASMGSAACWSGRRKGEPQAAESVRGRVPMRGSGADRLVVAVKVL